MDPTIFGSDVVDNVDDVAASHINNLRAWLTNFAPLIVNMASVSDTDGVTTFTDTDLPFQSIDCLGDTDYKVYLPAVSTDNHPFYIFNASTDSQEISVLNASSDSIDTIPTSRSGMFLSNGLRWESVSGVGVTATATPTADSIPISDGSGYLDSWLSFTPTATPGASEVPISDTDGYLDSWVEQVKSGTSFPVSPATNDRFFRTDLGYLCYYDGTRWLTVNEYSSSIYDNETFGSSDSTEAQLALSNTHNVYIKRLLCVVSVETTNNGSNYWTLSLIGGAQNYATETTFATMTTAAISADNYAAIEADASTNVDATNNKLWYIYLDKSGSPGDITLFSFTIHYRKIIT